MREGIFAFLGGVVVGGIAALLLAPKSGKETRDEIKKYIEDAEKVLKEKGEYLLNEGKKQLDKIKEKAQDIIDEGKEIVSPAAEKQKKTNSKSSI